MCQAQKPGNYAFGGIGTKEVSAGEPWCIKMKFYSTESCSSGRRLMLCSQDGTIRTVLSSVLTLETVPTKRVLNWLHGC